PGFERVTLRLLDGGASAVVVPRQRYRFSLPGSAYFVAPDGDDAAPGTQSRPWQTLAHALSVLKAGDLLSVRAGDYPTPIAITRSGTAGAPIVITSYECERVRVFQPPGWQAQNLDGATVTFNGVSHVWLQGLDVEGGLGQAGAPPDDHFGQNAITLAGGGD